MQTGVDLEFANGEYNFRLTYPGLCEIQRMAGAKIMAVYADVMSSTCAMEEITEIIRQGLMGGSGGIVDGQPVAMSDMLARSLIARYVTGDQRKPLFELLQLAQAILLPALVGYEPSNEAEKKSAGNPETEASTTASSSEIAP